MTFYIKIEEDGYITDCIKFPYKDYVECEFTTPLPHMFIAGCYKLIDSNSYALDSAKLKELEELLPNDDIET